MHHEAVAARIEIGPADHHHAVEQIEKLIEVFVFFQHRNDDGNAAGLDDRIVVPRAEVTHRWAILASGAIVHVDPDQWLTIHRQTPCVSTRPVSCSLISDELHEASRTSRAKSSRKSGGARKTIDRTCAGRRSDAGDIDDEVEGASGLRNVGHKERHP